MSEYKVNEEVDGESSSTEYWPESGSSVAATLSPESNVSEETLWEELNPSIEESTTHDSGYQPNQEPQAVEIFHDAFIGMYANTVDTTCVLQIPPVESGEVVQAEVELEPPVLTREQKN